jgi:hypothetical protein
MSKPRQDQPAATASRKLVGAIAALTIVVAGLSLYLTLYPRPPRGDRGPHRALGEILAREAIQARKNVGRIYVIARELETFDVPAAEAQLKAFESALKKAHVPITRTQFVKADPLRVVGVAPGDFVELMRKAGPNDVIVSFQGPPVLDAAQLAKLGAQRPRVLAVCSGAMPAQVDLKKIFAQGLLHAVVISLPAPSVHSSGSGAQGEFERMFRLVTAANLNELPSSPEARL